MNIFIIIFLVIIILILILIMHRKQTYRPTHKGVTIDKYLTPQLHEDEELVVSVCGENLDWIDKMASGYKLVTVYNKCGKRLVFNQPNIKVVTLPNIGSCDYAFLTYIIDRYDTLPHFVEFTKGSQKSNKIYHNCLACYNKKKDVDKLLSFKISNYPFTYNKNMNNISPFIKSGYKNMGEWIDNETYLKRSMYQRNLCNTIYGGHFGTTKEKIRSTPLKVYNDLRDQQKYPREEIDHFIERTWYALFCRPRYELVIVAIFKNEAVAMREWLEHYTQQGVEHFYMIDNGSTDEWKSQIEGFPVTVYSDQQRYKQTENYNDYFLDTVKVNAEWVMIVDLDEFMYARETGPYAHPTGPYSRSTGIAITDILRQYPDDIGEIRVRWKMFGSDGRYEQPSSIRQGFVHRKLMSETHAGNNIDLTTNPPDFNYHVKSIVRTSFLKRMNIHTHNIGNAIVVVIPPIPNEESLMDSNIHLNHYAIQSRSWFDHVKITRGAANDKNQDNVRDDKYFNDYDVSDIRDTELSLKSLH